MNYQQPEKLRLNNQEDRARFDDLIKNTPNIQIVDTYKSQLAELFVVKNPEILFAENKKEKISAWIEELKAHTPLEKQGFWIWYPWRNTIVHTLDKGPFRAVRFSRNNPLITPMEQMRLTRVKIGFAGLNVGNPGAVCAALEGIGMLYKMADPDYLDLSNLNRFRGSLCDVGINKALISSRQVHEIDPHIRIQLYESGITQENIDEFLLNPRIDVLVEEVDNLSLKIELRERARQYGIPVVMVTGNGPGNIADVERFDLDREIPILNGKLPLHVYDAIKEGGAKNLKEIILLARDFMGDALTRRLYESFDEVGKTIAGIPQIAEASFIRGATLAYLIRRIVVNRDIKSGRYSLNLDDILV